MRPLTDRHKPTDIAILAKPFGYPFAKAKEKQRHTQANAVASYLLLPNRTTTFVQTF
jgi:Zn-dependent peptidase ImmA (M78 family)